MLDANQREVVYLPVSQSVIVEAPPGHGKTFVMAKRINHLIKTGGVKTPKKILGLTFTNAAASEMRERILKSLVDKLETDSENSASESSEEESALEKLRRKKKQKRGLRF